MQSENAELYINKNVKLVLTNGFHFTGRVLKIDNDSMHILDKFNSNVSVRLNDIMVCSEILQ